MWPLNKEFNTRRKFLSQYFDIQKKFEALEESCIPSYLHKNKLAAWTAWQRLATAKSLYNKNGKKGNVLDFGAGSGELYHLIKPLVSSYSFIEIDSELSAFIKKQYPESKEITLGDLSENSYDTIFALDSLEHNKNYPELLEKISNSLTANGTLVLSGPSENWIYKLGRRIAGFEGHYHHTTIKDIEREAEKHLTLIRRSWVPFGIPIFSLSIWTRK